MKKNVITILENVKQYLVLPTSTNLLYQTPAQQLREQADKMEQKERDIQEFVELLDYLKQSPKEIKF